MHEPPPLPRRFGDIHTVVAVGTLLWLVAALALGLAWLLAGRQPDLWFQTCVAGVLLGGVGHGISTWQRAAARRGSRGAQRGTE